MTSDVALGFDLDHTLVVDNKLEKTVALDMVAEIAASRGASFDRVRADGAIDVALHAYRAGEQSLEAAIAGFFEQLVPGGGSASDVIDEAQNFREHVLERAPAHIEGLPGVAAMFDALDALGVPYAVLSNGWSPLQEEKARAIGFRGPVFVSERIGVRKPSREAFATLATHFEVPLERIWYVGDDPYADCAGAHANGVTSVWFDWEGVAYPPQIARPDYVIHKLDELPSLVEGRLPRAANAPR